MKKISLLIFFILLQGISYAGISNTATQNWALQTPPKDASPLSLYDYMYSLYSHFNQLAVTTNDPNGTRIEQIGSMILYNNSGTFKFCVETNNPSGTVWKCSNLS